ncbi:hypothetical protein SLS62_006627 [Diatrype stigma]|uniref:Amino acid permease/ SLC12A domain-containing protein n=1 Tax=Diatrype stigma TaxID=117547 RepID=A0AAN9YNW6_9PEZI
MTQWLPDWVPPWAVGIGSEDRSRNDVIEGEPPSISHLRSPGQQLNPDKGSVFSGPPPPIYRLDTAPAPDPDDAPDGPQEAAGYPFISKMITINATLGSGLYWRGGMILQLGGPLAVLLSFLLIGVLAWAVMQCITEMLCIWPIPGALSVYVSEFVDDFSEQDLTVADWTNLTSKENFDTGAATNWGAALL